MTNNLKENSKGADLGKGPLFSLVSDYIRHSIETHVLKPGDVIDFAEIGRALGTSRTPIREVIGQFHMEGLLEALPDRQFRVALLPPEKIEAYYLVRHEMEVAAASIAATTITPYEIGLLHGNTDLFRVNINDPRKLMQLDKQFHEIIYDATRNRYLTQRLRHLRGVLGLMPMKSFDQSTRIHSSIDEHVAIVDALAKGDADAAASAMSVHVINAKEARTGLL